MPPDHIDVCPEPVDNAGRQTAATAADWSSWAGRAGSRLRDAAGGARSTKVGTAFDSYLARWNPTFTNLGVRAGRLGGNAVAAAGAVVDSDGDGATLLSGHTTIARYQSTYLHRPVNGPW